jgi:glutaredoxin
LENPIEDIMTPYEEKQLLSLDERLSKEIWIGLIETDHPKSRAIKRFCDKLIQLVPKIRVKKEEGDPDQIPVIRIHNGLRYQAVPAGTEIAPFIEALQMLDSDPPQIDASTNSRLAKIDLPTNLVIYVSPQCKFCPKAVSQLLPLLTLNDNIRLTVVDAMHFPELAEKENIQSVPTLILEEQYRWTATFQLNEIIEMMTDRNPGVLGPASLEMMLKEGKAGQLAEMMLEKAEIFPAFYELLIHPKWPVRLGAMVVMDELIKKNLKLAAQTLEPLWKRFSEVDDSIRGDVLYIFGQMGCKEMAPRLENVLNGDHEEEVKEAAKEALQKLTPKRIKNKPISF